MLLSHRSSSLFGDSGANESSSIVGASTGLLSRASVHLVDCRGFKDFSHTTFSGYSKAAVRKELLQSLCKKKPAQAGYWCAELIASGHYFDVWDVIFSQFACVHVDVRHCGIMLFINDRVMKFGELFGRTNDWTQIRNDLNARRLIAETCVVLCSDLVTHRHAADMGCTLSPDDFAIDAVRHRFQAPRIIIGSDKNVRGLSVDDAPELLPSINELVFALDLSQINAVSACFWIEWLLKYEENCARRKEKPLCKVRQPHLPAKVAASVVWLIWEVFLDIAATMPDLRIILSACQQLFAVNMTTCAHIRARKSALFFGVSMLCDRLRFSRPQLSATPFFSMLTSIDTKTMQRHLADVYGKIKLGEQKLLHPATAAVMVPVHSTAAHS